MSTSNAWLHRVFSIPWANRAISKFIVRKTPTPRVALIGSDGVGKQSTIEALFNGGKPISWPEESGDSIRRATLSLSKGPLDYFDIPDGNHKGEDLAESIRIALTESDIILWVLDGSDFSFSPEQAATADILRTVPGGLYRTVLGINKIDKIEPGQWISQVNVPSHEQTISISAVVDSVRGTSLAGVALPHRVVAYSAEKRYCLTALFSEMSGAVSGLEHQVSFDARRDLADFQELIDPAVIQKLRETDPGLVEEHERWRKLGL